MYIVVGPCERVVFDGYYLAYKPNQTLMCH